MVAAGERVVWSYARIKLDCLATLEGVATGRPPPGVATDFSISATDFSRLAALVSTQSHITQSGCGTACSNAFSMSWDGCAREEFARDIVCASS